MDNLLVTLVLLEVYNLNFFDKRRVFVNLKIKFTQILKNPKFIAEIISYNEMMDILSNFRNI